MNEQHDWELVPNEVKMRCKVCGRIWHPDQRKPTSCTGGKR